MEKTKKFQEMRRKSLTLLLTSLIQLFLPTLSQSNEKSKVNITIDNWPPFEYIENGEIKGAIVEILERALHKLNIRPFYEEKTWRRGLYDLETSATDILLSGVWELERSKKFYYPDQALGAISWQVYSHKNPTINPPHNLLGLVNGYKYPQNVLDLDLFDGIRKTIVPDNDNMIWMLNKGHIKYGILDSINARRLLGDNPDVYDLIPVTNTTYYVPIFPLISTIFQYKEELNNILNQMHKIRIDKNGQKKISEIEEILSQANIPYLPNIPREGIFKHQLIDK